MQSETNDTVKEPQRTDVEDTNKSEKTGATSIGIESNQDS